MTDAPVRTQVRTDEGWLEFQEYFVHRHQAPDVHEVRFDGIEAAPPTAAVLDALAGADSSSSGRRTRSCRSGRSWPCPGWPRRIAAARGRGVPVMTVSGIIGGRALKGPADRMLVSLGHESQRAGRGRGCCAPHTDTFVLDAVDARLEPGHRRPRASART